MFKPLHSKRDFVGSPLWHHLTFRILQTCHSLYSACDVIVEDFYRSRVHAKLCSTGKWMLFVEGFVITFLRVFT